MHKRWIVWLTSIGIIMPLLDVTIVNIALPTLQRDLHAGFGVLQWVVNAYAIPLAVLLVTAGKLGDMFGRKRMFLIGLATFSAGSAVCALTDVLAKAGLPPIPVLLAGRVIQGAGGAALVPVTLAIVNEAFHEDEGERTRVIGTRGAMSGLGLAAGPLVGGALLMAFDWSSIFWFNVPIGIVTFVVACRMLDESTDPHVSRTIDWLGAALLSAGVFAVVLGLVLTDTSHGAFTLPVVGLIVLGLAILAVFAAVELRTNEPLYDLRLFGNRSFTGAAIAAFGFGAANLGLLFFLTLYLQNVVRLSPILTGVVMLPMTVTTLAGAPLAGNLMPRLGPRPLVTAGLAITGCGVLLLSLTPADASNPNWLGVTIAFLLIGSGNGLVNAPTVATATGTAGHEKAGLAAGINSVCRQIGVALGIALIGLFMTVHFDRAIVAQLPMRAAAAVQKAGTIAASSGLSGQVPGAGRLHRLPGFAHIARLSQHDWIASFHVGLWTSAAMLFLGAAIALATLRKRDLPQAS